MSKQQVVTWQAPGGGSIDVCQSCERKLTEAHVWPKDERGVEYCQVSYGLHDGECLLCAAKAPLQRADDDE